MERSQFPHPGFARQHPRTGTRAAAAAVCLAIHIAVILALVLAYAPRGRVKGLAEVETTVSLVAGQSRSQPSPAQPEPETHFVVPQIAPAESTVPPVQANPESPAQSAAPAAEETFQIGGATDAASPASDFRDILLRHIAAFRRYPNAGLASRLSGTTHVAFTINRAGGLLAVWLQETSGSNILDAEALDTIRRSQPFPPIPPDLSDPLTATLPVSFMPPP